jgi:predicted RNA-binding Zn-ribbon protein involved in translation (DUF1610 family)
MTTVSTKIQCPKCGAEMNLHAQKIVYAGSSTHNEPQEELFNGALQEFHSCPQCGAVASRNVAFL